MHHTPSMSCAGDAAPAAATLEQSHPSLPFLPLPINGPKAVSTAAAKGSVCNGHHKGASGSGGSVTGYASGPFSMSSPRPVSSGVAVESVTNGGVPAKGEDAHVLAPLDSDSRSTSSGARYDRHEDEEDADDDYEDDDDDDCYDTNAGLAYSTALPTPDKATRPLGVAPLNFAALRAGHASNGLHRAAVVTLAESDGHRSPRGESVPSLFQPGSSSMTGGPHGPLATAGGALSSNNYGYGAGGHASLPSPSPGNNGYSSGSTPHNSSPRPATSSSGASADRCYLPRKGEAFSNIHSITRSCNAPSSPQYGYGGGGGGGMYGSGAYRLTPRAGLGSSGSTARSLCRPGGSFYATDPSTGPSTRAVSSSFFQDEAGLGGLPALRSGDGSPSAGSASGATFGRSVETFGAGRGPGGCDSCPSYLLEGARDSHGPSHQPSPRAAASTYSNTEGEGEGDAALEESPRLGNPRELSPATPAECAPPPHRPRRGIRHTEAQQDLPGGLFVGPPHEQRSGDLFTRKRYLAELAAINAAAASAAANGAGMHSVAHADPMAPAESLLHAVGRYDAGTLDSLTDEEEEAEGEIVLYAVEESPEVDATPLPLRRTHSNDSTTATVGCVSEEGSHPRGCREDSGPVSMASTVAALPEAALLSALSAARTDGGVAE